MVDVLHQVVQFVLALKLLFARRSLLALLFAHDDLLVAERVVQVVDGHCL